MKLKENQEKKFHIVVSNPPKTTSVCMEWNSSTPKPLGHELIDIPEGYNLYSTSEPDKLVVSKQR